MNLNNFDIIDLSHPISCDMPLWPGDPKTKIKTVAEIPSEGYFINNLSIGEHSGTHIGAAKHFVEKGGDVSSIPINRLFVPAIKINIADKVRKNKNYLASLPDIVNWEKINGEIKFDHLILLQTNWSDNWPDSSIYFRKKKKSMNFPGFSKEAVEFLIANRKIIGIGIDSPGIDGGGSTEYSANKLLAKAGLYHLENLTNLKNLCFKNIFIFIGALPIISGSGSPCRIIALQPKSKT